MQLSNENRFFGDFYDAQSDDAGGKPLGKHEGSRREACAKTGKHGKLSVFHVGNGGKQPRQLHHFIILNGDREAEMGEKGSQARTQMTS